MFKLVVLFTFFVVCTAFGPARMNARASSSLSMSDSSISYKKVVGAALAASTLFSGSAFAVEGAAPKQSFFGQDGPSSPFSGNENREDPLFSPYSPYGNGEAAVYKEGKEQEITFWNNQLSKCITRTENVPKFSKKQNWQQVRTELTSYAYNMREAMTRLAASSSDPTVANAKAKQYFVDINDIFEMSYKKDPSAVRENVNM